MNSQQITSFKTRAKHFLSMTIACTSFAGTGVILLICVTMLLAIGTICSPLILIGMLWKRKQPLFDWWDKQAHIGTQLLLKKFSRPTPQAE